MGLHARLLSGILCAGVLFLGVCPVARAGAPGEAISRPVSVEERSPVVSQPGSAAEVREYGRREEASPEVQDFSGGEVVVGVSLLAVVLIVLIVYLVTRD